MHSQPQYRSTLVTNAVGICRALQEEVLAKHDGDLSFDALQDMTLLENSIKETLRVFPPLIALMRKAFKAVEYTSAKDGKTYVWMRFCFVYSYACRRLIDLSLS